MRGRTLLACALAALVTIAAAAGAASPARAVTGAALTVSVPAGAMLTLPATDGFRDRVPITITARSGWTVDVLAVGRTSTVVLARGVGLHAARSGFTATVTATGRHLHRGAWTIRARRSGHAGTTAVASRHLRVGTGTVQTIAVVPGAGTYFPFKDGHLDTVSAVVTARDETGTTIPSRGEVRLAAGRHTRSAAVHAGGPVTVRLSALGLPLGSASLVAHLTGPAGTARTTRRTLSLAATRLTKATVRPSGMTVEPVVDGMADTISVKVGLTSSTGVAVPVSGRLALSRDGAGTVLTWPLHDSKARTITWDGRLNGVIVPGTYRFAVSASGPEGAPRTVTSDAVEVTTDHLPFRIEDRFLVGIGNQQGLAVSGDRVFVTTDAKGGLARIDEYTRSGAVVRAVGTLPLGHAAEVAVRDSTGELYVANGGPTDPTKVFVVDPSLPDPAAAVVRTYDLTGLGPNGMVAFDQEQDRMIVFAGTEGAYTVTPVELDGTTGASLRVDVAGLPQGIELVHGELWVYTSLAGVGNRITRVNASTGATIDTIELAMKGEGEGLAYDAPTDTVFVGAHSGNRVGTLQAVPDE